MGLLSGPPCRINW